MVKMRARFGLRGLSDSPEALPKVITGMLLVIMMTGGARVQTAETAELACAPSGQDPGRLGVVLLHGKQTFALGPSGSRGGGAPPSPASFLTALISAIKDAGFRVNAPEMPWTLTHAYDHSFEQAIDRIADAAKELRAHGTERIVVGGQSLGASAALGYAVLRDEVAGVIVLSPGQFPDLRGSQERLEASIAKARAMVAAGKGNESATFEDLNLGRTGSVRTTAANYLSYWNPDGHAVIARNVATLPPGTPLLWVFGEDDPLTQRLGQGYAYAKAPPHPLNRYLVVSGGHMEAPTAAAPAVVAWLKCL